MPDIKIGNGTRAPAPMNTKRHRYSREQILFVMISSILLLSLVQMAMQLYIFDKARTGIGELQQVDLKSNQAIKSRQIEVIQILHNQEQIETATNATLAKMLKMEGHK